jgi:hypothetical protein
VAAGHCFESSTRLRLLTTAIALVFPLALASASGGASRQEPQLRARDPVPLGGIPLRRETGVRLVVADKPPFVLDIDTGSIRRIRGVRGPVWVIGVGSRAAVAIAQPFSRLGQVYAVRGNEAAVSRLGAGLEVASAAPDAGSVWVKRFVRPSHCTLRRVRLDGRMTRAPRSFACAWTIYPGGSLGLGVSRTRVIDPLTQRTAFRTPKNTYKMRLGIAAIAGKKVVLENGSGRDLALMDTATGTWRRVEWPSTSGQLYSLPGAVDVRGRFVALQFGNPSWTSEAGQAFDVWVLDTETARLTQLPDMPAFVALKRTNVAWTDDGWLVLLTESAGKVMVAVWKPGQERLEIKTLDIPSRDHNGIFSFAVVASQ